MKKKEAEIEKQQSADSRVTLTAECRGLHCFFLLLKNLKGKL